MVLRGGEVVAVGDVQRDAAVGAVVAPRLGAGGLCVCKRGNGGTGDQLSG